MALTGIVDYTPGDLTLTARAGTTLAEIAARHCGARPVAGAQRPGVATVAR